MKILSGYKDTKCYKKMESQNQESFNRLAEFYGKKLNENGNNRGENGGVDVLFTSHNFNNHCNNLFFQIDNILIKDLTKEECYLLSIAVLFHDFSIAEKYNWDRKKHAKESAELLKKEYNNTASPLHAEASILTDDQIEIVCEVIKAHSDGDKSEENYGLKNKKLKNKMGAHRNINGQLIAVILRLADELDICSNRIGNKSYCNQLEKTSDSYKHWKKLEYFKTVYRDEADTSIIRLEINKEKHQEASEEGSVETFIEDIISIKEKIKKNFSEAKNFLKMNSIYSSYIGECNFSFYIDDDLDGSIMAEITSMEQGKNLKATSDFSVKKDSIDKEIEIKISEFISSNNLFEVGHFIVNDTYCSRDWVHIHKIMENNELSKECVNSILDNLKKRNEEDYIFVGIGYSGALLASKIALRLQKPFSYIIAGNDKKYKTQEEQENEIIERVQTSKTKKVVIFTDVVATWETFEKSTEKIKDKIEKIYALLYRKPVFQSDEELKENENNKKLVFLNGKFPIEMVKTKKCVITEKCGDEKCVAKIKPIY